MLPAFPHINITNPATASSRIYVGNLNKDATKEELYEAFNRFGEIQGIKVHKNFAFIQFAQDENAEEAIRNSNQIVCHGNNVIVRPSAKGKQKNQRPPNAMNQGPPNQGPPNQQNKNFDYSQNENDVGPPRPKRNMKNNRNFPKNAPNRQSYDNSITNNRGGGNWQYQNNFEEDNSQPYVPPPTDCEIIVVSTMLTEYAEFIEDKLKQIGLTVDVLYPNENVPIGKVLTNIASRGCLYAILLMPENYENGSLTLNILHGLSQEHRNIPLDDSIKLIARNYAELQDNGENKERPSLLLHKLVTGKILSVMEYDIVLKHIIECREKQIKTELGENAVTQKLPVALTPAPQTKDLQERILSILNNTNKPESIPLTPAVKPPEVSQPSIDLHKMLQNVLKTPSTASPQPVPAPPSKPILSNPSFQKALDSLKSTF